MSIINAKLCFVQIIVKCFLKQFHKANIFKNVKNHFFSAVSKAKLHFCIFFCKKMYFRNSYWIESKKIFLDLWYFSLCSGLIFCWKKQKPSQNIKKCPKNRVLFLEQFRGNRTISTPLEFSKISFFQKMCFSWFALYLDPTDW